MESLSSVFNGETPSPQDFGELNDDRRAFEGDYSLLPNHEELRRKQLRGDSITDVMSSNILPNILQGQDKSSNCRDSSFIDLKLGRFDDHAFKEIPNFSSPKSNLPTKRGRTAGSNVQSPLCQVLGCDKDLSSSKDYHKRHRVCKDHSVTPIVTVNGFEQRFCQQCSRFHLLAEFDNGKRSCRKRLAGHNERRRKPPLTISSRTGRFIPSYNGSAFYGTASAVCHGILSNGLMHPKTFEGTNDWRGRRLNVQARTASEPSAITAANLYPHPKPLPYNFEKRYFEDGIHIPTPNNFTPDKDLARGPKLSSQCSLYENDSSESDVFPGFHGFSGFRDSEFALSLLSAQPQKNTSSNHSGMVPLANNLSSSMMKDQMCEEQYVPNFAGVNEILHGSNFVHAKEDQLLCEDGSSTIDLLQLSSLLHRVEHQRHDDDGFCCMGR